MSEQPVALTPAETAAQKRRNLWLALSIAGFVLLVFFITLARLKAGVLDRPL